MIRAGRWRVPVSYCAGRVSDRRFDSGGIGAGRSWKIFHICQLHNISGSRLRAGTLTHGGLIGDSGVKRCDGSSDYFTLSELLYGCYCLIL